jgi:hypothetical protein
VSGGEAQSAGLDPQFVKSLDPALVGAAVSKLFAASIGDIVVVLSRSPAHKQDSQIGIDGDIAPAKLIRRLQTAKAADRGAGVLSLIDATILGKVDRCLRNNPAGRSSIVIVRQTSSLLGFPS